MYCHEAFRCPRENCPVRRRRLRQCWQYFKSQGLEVTVELCPYAPCERCHYHMGWEIGLIGESLFTEDELPADSSSEPPREVVPSVPVSPLPPFPDEKPQPAAVSEPTSPAETQSQPVASGSETVSSLPPFPPESTAVMSQKPPDSASPDVAVMRPAGGAGGETPAGAPPPVNPESDDNQSVTIDDLLPTGELTRDLDTTGLVTQPSSVPGESRPAPPEVLAELVGVRGNRFCWEVMNCDNPRCPVRQRQIIRCFAFYGSRTDEEKQRLCGCQRSCSECHYKRGWDLGILHEGLFEDLLEERRRKTARIQSLQQRGIVEIYLQELARKPLTRSEEVDLARRLAGDRKASELLLTANLKLVVRISSQFANRGLSIMDLIQEGNLGLIKAISKFDWRLGYKFSTYAAYWIRHYMQRAVSNQGRVLRVPHHLLMVAHKIKRAINDFQGQWQRSPNLTELARLVGLEEEKVLDIIRITETPISIEARQPDSDDEESPLEYFLADKTRLSPEEEMLEKAKAEACAAALKTLPDRLREVVECFYGFRDEEVSLAELGRRMGVSRERVRQLLQEALKKLGEHEFVADLKDFLTS